MSRSITPKNHRDLNQDVLPIRSKFGSNGLQVIVRTNSGLTHGRTFGRTHSHTHRQTQATTIHEAQNQPRVTKPEWYVEDRRYNAFVLTFCRLDANRHIESNFASIRPFCLVFWSVIAVNSTWLLVTRSQFASKIEHIKSISYSYVVARVIFISLLHHNGLKQRVLCPSVWFTLIKEDHTRSVMPFWLVTKLLKIISIAMVTLTLVKTALTLGHGWLVTSTLVYVM